MAVVAVLLQRQRASVTLAGVFRKALAYTTLALAYTTLALAYTTLALAYTTLALG